MCRDSLLSITRPKTVWSRSSVLQFHRWCLNWCWHSTIHSLAPSLIDCIRSGWSWHSCRCLLTRPGMLLQITRAPNAPMYLRAQKATRLWYQEVSAVWLLNVVRNLDHLQRYHLLGRLELATLDDFITIKLCQDCFLHQN